MFDLATFLPYLLNRAGTRVARAFGRELMVHDLTIQKWRVLAALWHQPNQSLGALAQMTSLEVSTLSRLIGGLERRGLARRRRSGGDGRTVTIALSAKGRRITEKLIPIALDYESTMLTGFTKKESALLKSMLVRVYESMERFDGAEESPAPAAPTRRSARTSARRS
ncbi:MAG: MarR family winged helix-turn-helix transcriptional regulator [Alphaproteobacteria bacterium]|nr:MarR family winged helix-turn-helix transcriptional regulator [Alphaproteobacteria bacterium]